MHELCIKFLETRVRVNTNCGMYGAFLKKYFSPAIVGMDSKGSDITIDVLWEHGDWKQTLSREIDEGFLKIGANTYLSNETVATVLKDRQKIFFVWSKKHHEIHSKAVIRSRSLGRIFSGMFRAARQEECFYQITIQSIYYPLFYYFNNVHKMAPLHASAVDYHGKGLLFCGLDGSGKTCCALSLIDDDKTHLISDNLVLVGSGKVHSCYEQIRIHQEHLGSFPQCFHRVNNTRGRHKGFYRLCDTKMCNGSGIDAVFFIESAPKNSIEEIALNEAVHRAVHLSRLSGELQRYPFFCSFYQLLFDGSSVSENEIVRSSFEKAKFFRLRLNFSDGLKNSASFLKKHAALVCC